MHKSVNEKEHRHNDLIQGVFSIILATILLLSVVEIQIINIEQLVEKSYKNASAYTLLEVSVVIGSIIINEILFHVMINYSRKFFYPPLSANAFHLRLSSLASICALLSVVFEEYLNIAIADNIITLAIGIVLAFVVYDDFSVAIKKIQGKPFSYKKHHLKKDLYIPHKDDDYQEDEFDAFK
jgi:divalent metal cation (Fe/Co/Zn/Cd) transporter